MAEPRNTAPGALSTPRRDETMDALAATTFDLVVIGGGISGVGVAREATRRGLSVAVLEALDFASGTSSKSTKLIHGGLRYLAMGDVALVRKSARERKEIHRLAPHLADPRFMVVPSTGLASAFKIRAGVTAYEKLGQVAEKDLHENWSRGDLDREEPLLSPRVAKYACAYREYLTDDAHLVFANARDAAARGAVLLNYAKVDGFVREGERVVGVEAACGRSGRRITVRGRCFINAAGPWVDGLRKLEDPSAESMLVLSKGVHISLPAERLPVNHMMMLTATDGRPCFVIRNGECTYAGTTDTLYDRGAQWWPEVTAEDVLYILDTLNRSFEIPPLQPKEVSGAWAGLRPLIAQPGRATKEISRKDEVLVGPGGVVTLAGGKLTGYRPMAKECVERAADAGGLTLAPDPGKAEPLPGGDFDGDLEALAERVLAECDVSPECAARLVRLYGTETPEVLARGTEPLFPGSSVLRAEVDWAVDVLGAARVEDVVYRRIRSALFLPHAREASGEAVARRMAELLGWTPQLAEEELAATREQLGGDLSFLADLPAEEV